MKRIMRKLKIWTASIASGFDSVISKVENHESVVECSIQELQKAAAHAKVKLAHLRRELDRMRLKLQQLEQKKERWSERALSLRDSDKPKALECLRRMKRCQAEIEQLQQEIPRHSQTADSIGADVRKLESRIDELRLRKRAFSTRECRAKALKISEQTVGLEGDHLEDTFERWELKLAESEFGTSASLDSFEDAFERDDETASLEAELESLTPETDLGDTPERRLQ